LALALVPVLALVPALRVVWALAPVQALVLALVLWMVTHKHPAGVLEPVLPL
jgi:hypothetical protein